MRFILEQEILHIVKEPMLKNCTHQTTRWNQIAISDDKDALIEMAEAHRIKKYRIVDRGDNTKEVLE